MIQYDQDSWENGIGGYKKEAIVQKGLEIQRKGIKGWRVFFDKIERGNIGCKGGEEHVDHKNNYHLWHHLIP